MPTVELANRCASATWAIGTHSDPTFVRQRASEATGLSQAPHECMTSSTVLLAEGGTISTSCQSAVATVPEAKQLSKRCGVLCLRENRSF